MGANFDCAMSSLFCAEDNASIFDDVDDNYGGTSSTSVVVDDCFDDVSDDNNCHQQQHGNPRKNLKNNQQQEQEEEEEEKFVVVGFSGVLQTDECLTSMFLKESQHFPGVFDYLKRLRNGDLDLVARNQAVNWIQKVQSYYNFGPLCFYLSVNYLDHFLSTYELPKGKAWMMQLLAVACLSIAAKVDETDVPFSLDLQVCESKFIFEAKTIQRMELLVMSTLNWRMQSVTPFSYIDYFLHKLSGGDQVSSTNSLFQAIQLIICTIKGIDWLEFKPSEIAAAVAISVTEETQTVENPDNASKCILSEHLQKERVMKCVEMMQNMRMNSRRCNGESGLSSTSVPQSPIGVLDAASCMSYKSDDTSSTHNNNNNLTPAPKRRKLDNKTFQLERS